MGWGQDVGRLREALAVALDAIGAPAFIVDEAGRVELANASGRAQLEADPDGTGARIAAHLSVSERPGGRTSRIGAGDDAWTLVIDDGDATKRAYGRLADLATQLTLTPRQREILALVSRGLSNRSIATTLTISEATVEQHVGTLMQRAGVESRAALIAMLLWG